MPCHTKFFHFSTLTLTHRLGYRGQPNNPHQESPAFLSIGAAGTILSIAKTMRNELIYPGNVVLTTYGVGVVIENIKPFNKSNNGMGETISTSFKARLWRQPGKSVASSVTAYLQNQCVSPSYFFFAFTLRGFLTTCGSS